MNFGKRSASARELGLANPALLWSGATVYAGGTRAYLTVLPIEDDTDELGIVAHGPDSSKVTSQVKRFLDRWSKGRPAQPAVTAYPASSKANQLERGAHVARPDTRLPISW